MTMQRGKVHALIILLVDEPTPYRINVQLWVRAYNGMYCYAGAGRFFPSLDEGIDYAMEHAQSVEITACRTNQPPSTREYTMLKGGNDDDN